MKGTIWSPVPQDRKRREWKGEKEGRKKRKRKASKKMVAPETVQHSGQRACIRTWWLILPAMEIDTLIQNIGKWYLIVHSKVLHFLVVWFVIFSDSISYVFHASTWLFCSSSLLTSPLFYSLHKLFPHL